ncbi:MAG: hypothetical protein CMO55_08880 [Verrucomicrobiales bacterium]|nr:hypothetical protein [Verrucomicrobiales bacterium]
MKGKWGRLNDPSHKGDFVFWFDTPNSFKGWWKYEDSSTTTDWEGSAAVKFEPNLSAVWTSSYGDIHWSQGWYDTQNNTIRIEDRKWRATDGVYIVSGSWGRADDPNYGGKFEFKFTSPEKFSGAYTKDGGSGGAWSGSLK